MSAAYIYFVLDSKGKRIAKMIKHTDDEAMRSAKILYGKRAVSVVNSGIEKPCCDNCGKEKKKD